MRPLALDLCCGKGGWTKGLLSSGWDVIGVDIEAWDGYPEEAKRILKDVRELYLKDICLSQDDDLRKVSLVCASPPCQEFSYRSFPFKRCRELAATVPPDKSIWEACVRIAKECNAPLVLENVRGAQKYMGKAVAHYGGFYLWGDVPALLPNGRAFKGFTQQVKGNRSFRGNCYGHKFSNQKDILTKTMSKKQFAAQAAIIPFDLARWIGECFKQK